MIHTKSYQEINDGSQKIVIKIYIIFLYNIYFFKKMCFFLLCKVEVLLMNVITDQL